MTRRFQLYLPDAVMTRLEMESQASGRSKADIIREALERHFAGPSTAASALSGIIGLLGDDPTGGG